MRNRWKLWTAGIALAQLLVIGADVALWPMPSEAEQRAASIDMEMKWVDAVMPSATYGRSGSPWPHATFMADSDTCFWGFQDGSGLRVTFRGRMFSAQRIESISIMPPDPVHPLIRLRRTLARVFPFLAE
jgi:hypothetical protein